MIYKCLKCSYISPLKTNVTRHIVSKHRDDVETLIESSENMESICQNMEKNGKNVEKSSKNMESIDNNLALNKTLFQCEKCTKILANNKSLKYHSNICKGVKNSLECYKCHKIFNTSSAKCKHIKICNEQSIISINSNDDKQINNNTNNITNNNTTNISGNQNNTINNTVNNITILAVNPNKLDDLEFVTDHITNPQLKNILKITHQDVTDAKKVTMLEAYMRELMNNPINKCIQKTNLQNSFSKIHTGENNWTVKHDKELYPLITCNVAQGFSDLMIERNDAERMIKTERKLQELKEFLDYMADEGYRNDNIETINHQTHLLFKELVQRIKGVVFEVTKISI